MEVVLLIARLVAIVGGVIACYGAFFLHEGEERRIQNSLESLWIQIDDLKSAAFRRDVVFL
jgi:hypothetical protein